MSIIHVCLKVSQSLSRVYMFASSRSVIVEDSALDIDEKPRRSVRERRPGSYQWYQSLDLQHIEEKVRGFHLDRKQTRFWLGFTGLQKVYHVKNEGIGPDLTFSAKTRS